MDSNVNNIILEIKAIETILIRLHGQYVGLNVLDAEPLQEKIKDMLDLQKKLKEEYNITYNSSLLDKHELYLHTLQNFLSHDEEIADEVSYNKFVELTNPYCVLPFEPKEE